MRPLAAVAILACVMAITTLASAHSAHAAPPGTRALWSANHETGSLSEWTRDGSGGAFVSGTGVGRVTRTRPHSGRRSARLTISNADGAHGDQAIRLFRWGVDGGAPLPVFARYRTWLYFPRVVTPALFFNLMQWKTKVDSGDVLADLSINIANRPDGQMYLYVYDSIVNRGREEAAVPLPAGKWVQLVVDYRFATGATGRATVYQDGQRIMDVRGVRTSFPSRRADARQWSVNNYTNEMDPTKFSLFVDDAAIAHVPSAARR